MGISEIQEGQPPSALAIYTCMILTMFGVILCLYLLLPSLSEYRAILEQETIEKVPQYDAEQRRGIIDFAFAMGMLITFILSGVIWGFLAQRYTQVLRVLSGIGGVVLIWLGLLFWLMMVTGSMFTDQDPLLYVTATMLCLVSWHISPAAFYCAYTGKVKTAGQIFASLSQRARGMICISIMTLMLPMLGTSLRYMLELPGALVLEKVMLAIQLAVLFFISLQCGYYSIKSTWLKPRSLNKSTS